MMTKVEAQQVLGTMLMRYNLTDAELEAIGMAGEALEDEWISVDDRLPEKYRLVLLYCPDYEFMMTAYRDANGRWIYYYTLFTEIKEKITHWRYLPDEPEVD